MEKLQFFKATVFADKSNISNPSIPKSEEILIPIEAISHLKKQFNSNGVYEVILKKTYPLSLIYAVSSISAHLKADQIQIL